MVRERPGRRENGPRYSRQLVSKADAESEPRAVGYGFDSRRRLSVSASAGQDGDFAETEGQWAVTQVANGG